MAELIDATNERRLAAIASGATGLPDAISGTTPIHFKGTSVLKPTHLLIQEMLEALAPHYVDHEAEIPVETPYTLQTWRAAAGIDEDDGFKRATTWTWPNPATDPTFSYGLIQHGDIAGYWIREEIVNGLKMLKWTRKEAAAYETQTRLVSGTNADFSAAVAAADTAWAGSSWGTITTAAPYRTCSVSYDFPTGDYRVFIFGRRSQMRVTLSEAAPVAADCEFFLQALAPVSPDVRDFYDFEGWVDLEWTSMESVAVAGAATTATMAGYTMTSPVSTPAASSGIVAAGDDKLSSSGATCWGLLKWDFSRE
jgi:hypothetical protein